MVTFDDRYLSAKPFIGKLQHGGRFVKFDALKNLNKCVGYLWHEIAGDVMKIETLAADNGYEHSDLAALVASKVYFNSQLQDEALEFALKAGDAFYNDAYFVAEFDDVYRESIQNKVLDTYTVLQQRNVLASDPKDRKPIDNRLTRLVERLWEQSRQSENHREAIAYAIESRRVDKLKELLESVSPAQQSSLLSYCLRNTLEFEKIRKYRNELLQCLIEIYSKLKRPDYINVCQCLIFLDQPEGVATVLEKLVKESKVDTLNAYQIAFDVYESATQEFIGKILTSVRALSNQTPEGDLKTRLNSLIKILSGDETVSLHMQFLIKNNKTDMLILKSMKDVVKSNVTHSATIISNGLMHAGTTCDDFLRDNLDWVGKASNWAKFTTVASLGVIHKGHENEASKILEPYLPKDSATATSGYVEGGGLYAYGLIHANHGNDKIIDYLKAQLNKQIGNDNNAAIIIKHGACLGLGLAAMGTHKQDVYDVLRSNLYTDDAVVGEAAALAMGLVMLGSKSVAAATDMTLYAAETQHEKTLRGLCVGLSLLNYGRLEEATGLIETLSGDKDPNMRRSAVYSLAMAYCGTGCSAAIGRLLKISVSDVNDDVRRAAVTCIGFVLCKSPKDCPTIVRHLAESYNPHVRYGSALALGIACAGTASSDALALTEPMMNDPVGYVRQGAFISTAMILMQHNEVSAPKLKNFRESLTKVIGDKGEDSMTKFGAIIAQGILDAAGRNAALTLATRNGHVDTASVVGILIFLQYWFWFPLTHFLSLAMRPTCLIALNGDLKMPKVEFRSNAKPSLFAYPAPLQEKKEKAAEKVETAILSITAKQLKKDKERQSRGSIAAGGEKMDIDETPKVKTDQGTAAATGAEKPTTKPPSTSTTAATAATGGTVVQPATTEPEATFELLNNPARVLTQQLKYMTWTNKRFEPLKNVNVGGIIMLNDKEADSPLDFVDLAIGGGVSGSVENEKMAPQPEPFEYVE